MNYESLTILIAYLCDLIFGDPRWMPHPVRGIGWLIRKLEPCFRVLIKNERLSGTIFAFTVISLTWFMTFMIIQGAGCLNRFLRWVISVFFIYSALAIKDLKVETMRIVSALEERDLILARNNLSMVVGRDTANLDENQIIRAAVETVAESTVDGIISPLFFAFLGGPAFVLAYKAVSTLDSMVGYKNERYKDFGWASARIDDLANFIPARISVFFLLLASWLIGHNAKAGLKITLRDRKNNHSPNSGIPEAAVAGALGIQLGGLNFYNSIPVQKPFIGDNLYSLAIKHVRESIRIAYLSSLLFMTAGMILFYAQHNYMGRR